MTQIGLYDSQYEHDACGVGFVARLDGKAGHAVAADALLLLKNLAHRGAAGADADSGIGMSVSMGSTGSLRVVFSNRTASCRQRQSRRLAELFSRQGRRSRSALRLK